jgi:hypothetical protein
VFDRRTTGANVGMGGDDGVDIGGGEMKRCHVVQTMAESAASNCYLIDI